MASAKLANRTVNQSQSVICSPKPKCPAWLSAFHASWIVVKTAPTSTTNITGFLIIVRGFSLRNESTMARVRMALSASDCFLILATGSMDTSESLSCVHQQMLENRSKTQSRKERESAYDQNGGDEQTGEESACDWKTSGGFRNSFLFSKTSGNGEHRNDHEETTKQLGKSRGRVVPHGVCADPAKRRAVVPGRRDICV